MTTTVENAPKTATPKTKDVVKSNSSQVSKFLTEREQKALAIGFHETKIGRLGDSYKARYVKNLANQIAKTESTEAVKVTAASVINAFRKGELSPERLTENRLRIYRSQFARQTSLTGKAADGLEFTDDDVKRDIIRMSNKIWDSGNFA